MAAALLALIVLAILWFAWDDRRDYARFKALTDTRDRQARFRVWIAKSFVVFLVMPTAGLVLLGRLDTLAAIPPEFAPARALIPAGSGGNEGGMLVLGIVAGALIGGALLGAVLAARNPDAPQIALGDIAPLMPRNAAETGHAALLSVNAGVSEEVAFRLYLPLLLALAGLPPVAALAAAALLFGIIHFYQGLPGVLATTLVGVVMTGVYLASGSLLLPIALHAIIDLNGLVLRPTLERWARRRAE